MTPTDALQQWLADRRPGEPAAWLQECIAALTGGGGDRVLYRSVSLAARRLGKLPLALNAAERALAQALRPGWDPSAWTLDQAARVLLVLVASSGDDGVVRQLDQLCATADVDELVAFYRGLPLYPQAQRHRARAAEGIRSNMKVVFEAVAHGNPYPAEQLAEPAWNQMVLKALFVGSTLDRVVGLDVRANPRLARMLGDYAHERWAAGRSVSPELWRCVGPFATGPLLDDLARVLGSGTPPERAAAMLALRSAPGADASPLLERHADLRDVVAARGIDWTTAPAFH